MNPSAHSQNILVISGSARYESDTKKFVGFAFSETPHSYIELLDYTIDDYRYDGAYSTEDQFDDLMEKILAHDIIVFATPVYWYAMSGKMKTLFDRFTDLVTINKPMGRALEGKTIFLFAVGNDFDLPEGFEIPFSRTAEYLHMNYGGCAYFSSESGIDHPSSASAKTVFNRILLK